MADNLLSLFVVNDNKKITKLLHKLIAIYSRSIRRIKLKYLLRYYENVAFANYIKYKKLNNMFKKKAVKYNNSFNSKNKGLNNNELLNSPAKNAYILNRS